MGLQRTGIKAIRLIIYFGQTKLTFVSLSKKQFPSETEIYLVYIMYFCRGGSRFYLEEIQGGGGDTLPMGVFLPAPSLSFSKVFDFQN